MKIIAVILCLSCVNAETPWGYVSSYDRKNGPRDWKDYYPECGGDMQSPIDFNEIKVIKFEHIPISYVGYDVTPKTTTLTNDGHAAVLTMDGTAEIKGVSFSLEPYVLHEMRFHWGENSLQGNEHILERTKRFAMEIQLVHFNKKFGNYSSALGENNGVAVLSWLVKIGGAKDNYTSIVSALGKIAEPGSSTTLDVNKPLAEYIKTKKKNYFRYLGSLTAPPCTQKVAWIVFTDPITIQKDTVVKFRSSLKDQQGFPLTRNCRPVQAINSRFVRKSDP